MVFGIKKGLGFGLIKEGKVLKIGGIVGYQFGKVSNCYNIGEIKGEAEENLYIGKVIGMRFNDSASINNIYYASDNDNDKAVGNKNDTEEMRKTEVEMKSQEFLNLLNIDNVWKIDNNSGYPILNWQ